MKTLTIREKITKRVTRYTLGMTNKGVKFIVPERVSLHRAEMHPDRFLSKARALSEAGI